MPIGALNRTPLHFTCISQLTDLGPIASRRLQRTASRQTADNEFISELIQRISAINAKRSSLYCSACELTVA